GVVDEAVETAEGVPRLECHRLCALEVAEVGAPHARLGGVVPALLEDLLEAVRAPGDDADGRSPFRELRRERGADPRRRAGDENGRAFDLHSGASLAFSTALRSAASRSSAVTPVVVSAWCTSGVSSTDAIRRRSSSSSDAPAPARAAATRSSVSGGDTCMSPAI